MAPTRRQRCRGSPTAPRHCVRRSRARHVDMRRRHSSHSWLPPAARMAVKGARFLCVHRSEPQTLDGHRSGGYAASAAPVADATTKITLRPQDAQFLHDPICNRNGCRRNPFRGGVSLPTPSGSVLLTASVPVMFTDGCSGPGALRMDKMTVLLLLRRIKHVARLVQQRIS